MRQMNWADIVPLGTYPTWAGEPNPSLAEIRELVRVAEVAALARSVSETGIES